MKRTIKLSYGTSGTIATKEFSNVKPSIFESQEFELEDGESIDKDKIYKEMKDRCTGMLQEEFDKEIVNKMKEAKANMKIIELDGVFYPSVTTIISLEKDFSFMSADQLRQYGCRGTVLHRVSEVYDKMVLDGKEPVWVDPVTLPELADELLIMRRGDLKLSIEGFNYIGFLNMYGKEKDTKDKVGKKLIEYTQLETQALNKEHKYIGTRDRTGLYHGEGAVFDIKSGVVDKTDCFKQLAAYAKSDDLKDKDIKQLVVIPINTKTEQGFSKPIVTDKISHYFKLFLADRERFSYICKI